jgi:hypothetical protein
VALAFALGFAELVGVRAVDGLARLLRLVVDLAGARELRGLVVVLLRRRLA